MKKLLGAFAVVGAYVAGAHFGNPLDQRTPTAATATTSGPQECTSEELRSAEYQRRKTEAETALLRAKAEKSISETNERYRNSNIYEKKDLEF